ncbi:MAG: DNA polymerase III subunit delta' [Armatimonadota bacterium]
MSDRIGLDRIIGQELARRILTRAAREQQPAHAYLFLGPEGTGKLTTAIEFARALNCENPHNGVACGDCAVCRAIAHGSLPDVRIWSPEGRNTKIEQMREMRDLAALRPMRARWKVNIIEQADTLNEESANCILKLVEEPPHYLVNILLYRNAAAVLPTIWSRCRLVRFTPVSAAELVDRLLDDYGINKDEARFLAAYSQGCPGKAIRLIGNSDFVERRDSVAAVAAAVSAPSNRWLALRLAESLRESGRESTGGLERSEETSDVEDSDAGLPDSGRTARKSARDAAVESLDVLLVWYRDLLAAKLQGDEAALVNVDRRDEIAAQAAAYPHAGRLLSAVEAILQARRNIVGNANPQLATEALLIRLMG